MPVGVRDLIDAHYESLYRYGCRLAGDANTGEDLVQETFRKAIGRLDQLRDETKAKPWLYRILRNCYLHKVRDDKRQRMVPLEAEPEQRSEHVPAVDPSAVQAALDELDESFRTPLILFYFEEFSYRDIAEHMDLPIGTVMSRLARAKAHLKARLEPQ